MSDNYNYGPRMRFEKLDEHLPANTPFVASAYMGPSPMMSASSASGLGPHWKKQNTASSASIVSAPPSSYELITHELKVPSTEASSNSTLMPTMNQKSSESTSSITDSSRSANIEVARQLFEERENKECLNLHHQSLDEINDVLKEQIDECIDLHVNLEVKFYEEKKNMKRLRGMWRRFVKAVKDGEETAHDNIENKANALLDSGSYILREFYMKKDIESFVRKNEGAYEKNLITMATMKSNASRVKRMQELVMEHKVDNGPLTVFEREDIRHDQVYFHLLEMIKKLPLSQAERADLQRFIDQTEEHFEYSRIYKCDLICRRLFSTMGVWGPASVKSDDWRSVCNLNGAVYSSSFSLADLSDSKLNDLEGELRAARMKVAEGGPTGVIEMNPWSSLATAYSSSGEQLVASNSLGEPWTLSSYECQSSDPGHTTCSSVSGQSMPTFENAATGTVSDTSMLTMKTALSADTPAVRIPRVNHPDKQDTTIGEITDFSSLSAQSLLDTIEDVIHTAKEISETQAASLLDALKNSANKCGVEVAELLTAASSSSESISDTQSSHHSHDSHHFVAH